MTHLIDPIEKTGLFRFCGKCPLCLKYFNPEDPPETGNFSNPAAALALEVNIYQAKPRDAIGKNIK
jgi:hypothetical protein